MPNMAHLLDKYGTSNKTNTVDKHSMTNIGISLKANSKSKTMRTYNENDFSDAHEVHIDLEGNKVVKASAKKEAPKYRIDAENFLKHFTAEYRKKIGGE